MDIDRAGEGGAETDGKVQGSDRGCHHEEDRRTSAGFCARVKSTQRELWEPGEEKRALYVCHMCIKERGELCICV